jgi:hypothetical protein
MGQTTEVQLAKKQAAGPKSQAETQKHQQQRTTGELVDQIDQQESRHYSGDVPGC